MICLQTIHQNSHVSLYMTQDSHRFFLLEALSTVITILCFCFLFLFYKALSTSCDSSCHVSLLLLSWLAILSQSGDWLLNIQHLCPALPIKPCSVRATFKTQEFCLNPSLQWYWLFFSYYNLFSGLVCAFMPGDPVSTGWHFSPTHKIFTCHQKYF